MHPPRSTPVPRPAVPGFPDALMLHLLGGPLLCGPGGEVWFLERKTAALLAYLALEGPTPRARLVSLLWPETREAAARNNLVHLLRKLRVLTGRALVDGRDVLTLGAALRCDVPRPGEVGGHAALLEPGAFLQGLAFDDCPELEEWVMAERERLDHRRFVALREAADAQERAGDPGAAIAHALRWFEGEPLSEDAARRLMRLYALTGNRHRALAVYDRLRRTLRAELDVEPLAETEELARAVLGGALRVALAASA